LLAKLSVNLLQFTQMSPRKSNSSSCKTRRVLLQVAHQPLWLTVGPVFGAPAAAVAAQLVYVLTGDPSSVEKIKPFTQGVMAKATIPLGPDVSKATLLKITGNTMILGMVEILSEALVFAEKSGLGTDNLNSFVQLMFPGSPFAAYSTQILSGGYAPVPPKRPGFQVDLALKDCKNALDLAKDSGARLEVVEVMERHLKAAKEVGGDNMDIRLFSC
jgi:3-hydroxyisobutyrate dehydrogenase-like beta-hydroxyacid dehydrogenase